MSSQLYLRRGPYGQQAHPKRLFKGFVSLGKTKSAKIVKDAEGCFGVIIFVNVISVCFNSF
jgi:hypothetical protein